MTLQKTRRWRAVAQGGEQPVALDARAAAVQKPSEQPRDDSGETHASLMRV
jgi:acyl dehydratase